MKLVFLLIILCLVLIQAHISHGKKQVKESSKETSSKNSKESSKEKDDKIKNTKEYSKEKDANNKNSKESSKGKHDSSENSKESSKEKDDKIKKTKESSKEKHDSGKNSKESSDEKRQSSKKVNGGFATWTEWDKCTLTCGGGTQNRKRTCTNPSPQFGGADCTGDRSQTQKCNIHNCPIDGGFTIWTLWDTCTLTCGGGIQNRKRTCTNPSPQYGGADCTGDRSRTQKCNTQNCPINGGFTTWASWDTCTVTCGGGLQSRKRTCTNPSPQYCNENEHKDEIQTSSEKDYIGCYKDGAQRLLADATLVSNNMTIELCLQHCRQKITQYAGVEFSTQCFCGNNISRYGQENPKECNMKCNGNQKQICGGIWRISVYKVMPYIPKCHINAELKDGKCVCKNGYVGDGVINCTIKCHSLAEPRNDRCICKRGYYGDGVNDCTKTCTCMASGDPHYKTYDGQMINFMGTCKYTLTQTTKDFGDCSFAVEVKNERRGQNTKVAYTRMVDVKIYGKTVRLIKGGKVSIDGQKKFLPVEENNTKLKIFYSGRFIQVWTECGVLVNFDGIHTVFVVVPDRFKGNLQGLCGDCNGKQDDLKTKKGTDVSKMANPYSLIGNSYSVYDDSDDLSIRCEPKVEDVPTECEPRMNNLVNEPSVCGDLQSLKGRFAFCVQAIPQTAKEYYNACVMDVCSYQGEATLVHQVKCSSLESFVEECAENGIDLKWRSDTFCPLKCEDPNMVYSNSGTGCPATCVDPAAPSKCTLEPKEGCFCKPGFILSDNTCVKLEECGCKDGNGDYYPIGSKVGNADCSKEYVCQNVKGQRKFVEMSTGMKCHLDASCTYDNEGVRSCVCKKGYTGDGYKTCEALCGSQYKCHQLAQCLNNRCVCTHGLYGDGINSCEEMCSCSASGDPHYRTYDGQMIHFMGDCKYTLTKSTEELANCSFNVEVKNWKRQASDKVAYTRFVEVYSRNEVIKLDYDRKLFVNGLQKYLPYSNKEKSLNVDTNGEYMKLQTECGISVFWNGFSTVRVVIPKKYGNMVTGICGNCNGQKDDYRTKEGVDVSNADKKYVLIGNSYEITAHHENDDSQACGTNAMVPECPQDALKIIKLDNRCGFLQLENSRSPFKDCINAIKSTAEEYRESCEIDACAYLDNSDEQKKVVCMALEAFSEECLILGYKVKWRTSDFCPIGCKENMRYSELASVCPASCVEPEASNKCTDEPTEGCECLPGFLFSDNKCIPERDCGCQRNSEYYPLNTTLVSTDCTNVEQCVSVNGESLFVQTGFNIKCHHNGMCGIKDGKFGCVCAEGFVGDGIDECANRPSEPLVPHETPRNIDIATTVTSRIDDLSTTPKPPSGNNSGPTTKQVTTDRSSEPLLPHETPSKIATTVTPRKDDLSTTPKPPSNDNSGPATNQVTTDKPSEPLVPHETPRNLDIATTVTPRENVITTAPNQPPCNNSGPLTKPIKTDSLSELLVPHETPRNIDKVIQRKDNISTKPLPCNNPASQCRVVVRHDSCGTETIVTGTCDYSNLFSSLCDFTVTTEINSEGNCIADVRVNGKKTRLRPGDNLTDCATFSVKGSLLFISEDTCERCILQFIRNMVPSNTCIKN